MAKYFDELKWDRLITDPMWYLGEIWDEIQKLKNEPGPEEIQKEIRTEIRNYFALKLMSGYVATGAGDIEMDSERKQIDTIVIHHTGSNEPYTLKYLNAVHLLNIYVPYFRNPTLKSEKHFKGLPLQSGHFYKGLQVFWGYHWFIDSEGKANKILRDKSVGWHAGNWEINTRSIGICLDGDFTNNQPTDGQLLALKKIISGHYKYIDHTRIIGHKQANPNTKCPGDSFQRWQKHIRE